MDAVVRIETKKKCESFAPSSGPTQRLVLTVTLPRPQSQLTFPTVDPHPQRLAPDVPNTRHNRLEYINQHHDFATEHRGRKFLSKSHRHRRNNGHGIPRLLLRNIVNEQQHHGRQLQRQEAPAPPRLAAPASQPPVASFARAPEEVPETQAPASFPSLPSPREGRSQADDLLPIPIPGPAVDPTGLLVDSGPRLSDHASAGARGRRLLRRLLLLAVSVERISRRTRSFAHPSGRRRDVPRGAAEILLLRLRGAAARLWLDQGAGHLRREREAPRGSEEGADAVRRPAVALLLLIRIALFAAAPCLTYHP
ncbi:hypothetical protein ACHAWF_006004 [Thalassiosira exigua]